MVLVILGLLAVAAVLAYMWQRRSRSAHAPAAEE
jgi:Tfp pilus assembly protein PilX